MDSQSISNQPISKRPGKRVLKTNMPLSTHSCVLHLFAASLFFFVTEHSRTEASFECGDDNIAILNATTLFRCCFRLEMPDDRFTWKKSDESIGGCTTSNASNSFDYICYSAHSTGDRYEFQTCGPNCFSITIIRLQETDYGEYYISLGSLRNMARKLVFSTEPDRFGKWHRTRTYDTAFVNNR